MNCTFIMQRLRRSASSMIETKLALMPNSIPTLPNAIPSIPRDRIAAIREVVVMRALPGLGDFLCVTPALRAIRSGLPAARITLLGLPSTRDLVARYRHLLDDFLDFPGFPGLPEAPASSEAELLDFLQRVHSRFDLALQMHGDGRVSNRFVQLLGARTIAGFDATFAPWPGELPEPRVWLSLLEQLGLPACGEQLEFPRHPSDEAELGAVLDRASVPIDSSLAIVHVGASRASRRLEPPLLARVAEGLSARGHAVVLTGAREEAGIAAAVHEHACCPTFDLSGRTTLGAFAALLERARIVVTHDTGASHLASALRTASVVVFLASDVQRWAPLDRNRHRIVDATRGRPSAEVILREADLALSDSRTNSSTGLAAAERVLVVPPTGADERFGPTLERLRSSLPNATLVLLARGDTPAYPRLVDEVVPGDALACVEPAALSALIDRLAAARLDAALVFTTTGESAFEVAHLAYLAGIPVRAGLATEFGGGVLSPCIRPPAGLPERARDSFLLDQLDN
jgi:ADP-heptose:LPS heptosyltransferase